MANLVGIGQATYSRKERGTTDVSMEEWIIMAKILGVSIDEIYNPNSRKSLTALKNNDNNFNIPLQILNELEQLKKENSELKDEIKKLKAKFK